MEGEEDKNAEGKEWLKKGKVSERPFIFHLLLQQKSQKKRMMKLIWANQRNQSRFGTVLLYF